MKITKKQLELKSGLQKEWLITNGIGGFASSTVIGANTRRYHGLLIGSLKAPAMRHLLLSKLDECLIIGNEKYNLYTNVCKDYISDGYKYLESFEQSPLPEYIYKVNNIKITKKITMEYGKNTVLVNYSLKNNCTESIKLVIAPIMNFRDFHGMNSNHNYCVNQEIIDNKVKVQIDGNVPVYLMSKEGKYINHNNDNFRNMYYIKEEERGFFPEEDLCVPGRYEFIIEPKKQKNITIIVSLESDIENLNFEEIYNLEINRLNDIVKNTKLLSSKVKLSKKEKLENEFLSDLIIACDKFIINRPEFGTHSILAGFPWFLDWGRDTCISFEGLLLITKRYDLAKEVLLTLTKDIKCGLVPNGYSESDGNPLYNSADSSLLLFEQVNKYLKYTKDYDFIKENIYEKLKDIIENYGQGIDLSENNIYIDEDKLLVSGTSNTQNTWMDAKIGNIAVTPRNGKVVELNALWYNALKTLENLAKKFGEKEISDNCKKVAKVHKKVFEEKFYNPNKKSLYDVLGDDKIRPNQLFSISVTYPVILPSSVIGKTIFNTVKKKLFTKYGLKTLAKNEPRYIERYEGDSFKRDMSYHQGISWVWLLGLYADSLENIIDSEKDRIEKEKYIIEKEKFVECIYNTFKTELYSNDCIGNISELYDSVLPVKPGGTCAQAWSVSEILKIIVRRENEK